MATDVQVGPGARKLWCPSTMCASYHRGARGRTALARRTVVKKAVSFYSEGMRLVGDVYYPDGAAPSEPRAGIVLCHGYTGVKDLYLPDNARVLNEAGYVVLTFDYKGWGQSEGARSRLAPYSRVADVQAALTFLGALPEVDPQRLGIYGTSCGGAMVVWTGAVDRRVKCVVSVVGIG
ncbi:MAG: alpha/beta fold hydrolase, partial [Candidatus Rokuibacteriota bacterium]